MLLEYSFQIKQSHIIRKFFFKKEISDTPKNTEAIVALSAQSREEVDQMMDKVVDTGGRESRDPQDHGWMYGRSFEDINGHLWGIFYMDMCHEQSITSVTKLEYVLLTNKKLIYAAAVSVFIAGVLHLAIIPMFFHNCLAFCLFYSLFLCYYVTMCVEVGIVLDEAA
jgi:hypothetical protein